MIDQDDHLNSFYHANIINPKTVNLIHAHGFLCNYQEGAVEIAVNT
jgi:hypothetical protein